MTSMPYCYILYSPLLDKFYIGQTQQDPESRLEQHLSRFYGNTKFTAKAKDWEIFISIPCSTEKQARAVEGHIKKIEE